MDTALDFFLSNYRAQFAGTAQKTPYVLTFDIVYIKDDGEAEGGHYIAASFTVGTDADMEGWANPPDQAEMNRRAMESLTKKLSFGYGDDAEKPRIELSEDGKGDLMFRRRPWFSPKEALDFAEKILLAHNGEYDDGVLGVTPYYRARFNKVYKVGHGATIERKANLNPTTMRTDDHRKDIRDHGERTYINKRLVEVAFGADFRE